MPTNDMGWKEEELWTFGGRRRGYPSADLQYDPRFASLIERRVVVHTEDLGPDQHTRAYMMYNCLERESLLVVPDMSDRGSTTTTVVHQHALIIRSERCSNALRSRMDATECERAPSIPKITKPLGVHRQGWFDTRGVLCPSDDNLGGTTANLWWAPGVLGLRTRPLECFVALPAWLRLLPSF